MLRIAIIAIALALFVGGCSTVRESSPQRTATEQLLISTAADRAADQVATVIEGDRKVFVDAANFEVTEGKDWKYAIGVIRDRLLQRGARLVAERGQADTVVEIRSGALSMDEQQFLVGIPRFDVPVPLAGPVSFPEIALFKKRERKGVAKFAATAYGASDGNLVSSSGPQYGLSHEYKWVVLLFWSWTTTDLAPADNGEPIDESYLPSLVGPPGAR